jgi:hypothetical protein
MGGGRTEVYLRTGSERATITGARLFVSFSRITEEGRNPNGAISHLTGNKKPDGLQTGQAKQRRVWPKLVKHLDVSRLGGILRATVVGGGEQQKRALGSARATI